MKAIGYLMKQLSCKDLGGACDEIFSANTFDEIAKLSQAHGKEKIQQKDVPHLEAAKAMTGIMADNEKMQAWMTEMKNKFDTQPDC